MNTPRNMHEGMVGSRGRADERLDLLISRIADAEASRSDWAEFEALASQNPSAWRDLAHAQRAHQSLSLAVGVALHAADRVELPAMRSALAGSRSGRVTGDAGQRFTLGSVSTTRKVAAIAGWGVAAMLALSWIAPGFVSNLTGPRPGSYFAANPGNARASDGNSASLVNIPAGYFRVGSPEDALQLYMDKGGQSGQVLGEMPERVILETAPAPKGAGYDVVYVRQIVERARVNDLMRFGHDESGRPVPVRLTLPAGPTGPQ